MILINIMNQPNTEIIPTYIVYVDIRRMVHDDNEGCTVVGATLTLSSSSNPVTPLSTSWINAHLSTHVPLEFSPPLPQFSPHKSPPSLCANFSQLNFTEGFKEKYLRYHISDIMEISYA